MVSSEEGDTKSPAHAPDLEDPPHYSTRKNPTNLLLKLKP